MIERDFDLVSNTVMSTFVSRAVSRYLLQYAIPYLTYYYKKKAMLKRWKKYEVELKKFDEQVFNSKPPIKVKKSGNRNLTFKEQYDIRKEKQVRKFAEDHKDMRSKGVLSKISLKKVATFFKIEKKVINKILQLQKENQQKRREKAKKELLGTGNSDEEKDEERSQYKEEAVKEALKTPVKKKKNVQLSPMKFASKLGSSIGKKIKSRFRSKVKSEIIDKEKKKFEEKGLSREELEDLKARILHQQIELTRVMGNHFDLNMEYTYIVKQRYS